MLLIIENDKRVRKRICDLLKRERILGVNTVTESLERMCKFRSDINLIICRATFLIDIQEKQLVQKVCERLYIKVPPMFGYYMKKEAPIKDRLEQTDAPYELIEYDEEDETFPEKFIKIAASLYPDLYYDIEKAQTIWREKLKAASGVPMDPRAWLEEQGFVEPTQKKGIDAVIPTIENLLREDATKETGEDYEKGYQEMKKKYEELSKYVKELIDFIRNL
jgi:hypothetical protein